MLIQRSVFYLFVGFFPNVIGTLISPGYFIYDLNTTFCHNSMLLLCRGST